MRNVQIYLERGRQDDIYRRFRDILHPDGLLFIAPCDQEPSSEVFRHLNDSELSAFFSVPEDAHTTWRPVTVPFKVSGVAACTTRCTDRYCPPSPLRADLWAPIETGKGGALGQHAGDDLFDRVMEWGQQYLADDRLSDTVANYRQAVFSQPSDLLSRFCYAVSLQRSGVPKRSLVQLNNLRSMLNELAPDTILSDGKTTVGELLSVTVQLKEQLT